MKRVIIIGCPGGGKSTFARALHGKTGIPLYHLDLLYWNADRKENRPGILALLKKYADRQVHIFSDRQQADAFLRDIGKQ